MPPNKNTPVESFVHEEAHRANIPTAELETVMREDDRAPKPVRYSRNTDLDPQFVWRGKDQQDWSDLVVQAPPLYIQEKVHPKVLIEDLRRQTETQAEAQSDQLDFFADFNGIPDEDAKTEFYQHEQNWTNRMILGDSLQVMASLAEREGLRGQVQCIYLDPPYGIKFNSNFQWSTTSRDVKDGKADHITREPEQVKAFRDTWRDGIHSYLTYLRDRLTVARDLLHDTGSIFVQIGDENVHRVRAVMDEVFGEANCIALISYAKTTGFSGSFLSSVTDYILWYGKNADHLKYRPLHTLKEAGDEGASKYREAETIKALANSAVDLSKLAVSDQLTSQGASANSEQRFDFQGKTWLPPSGLHWKTTVEGMGMLAKAGRVMQEGKSVRYVRFLDDFAINPRTNVWLDIGGIQSRTDPKVYVVQTATEAVKRCLLMATDPGDLVLDPTCGSGTTAYVAEQWGRRWITVDTSRVALALARARIMGARYPYYLLADSPEGQQREATITRTAPSMQPTRGGLRQGFVYERVPHITLKSIANNAEIDVIWEQWQPRVLNALQRLNQALQGHATPFVVTSGGRQKQRLRFDAPDGEVFTMPSGEEVSTSELVEWEVPREAPDDWPASTHKPLADFWEARIARQQEIDASIAAKADFEYLYDKPYEDRKRIRVAGPFTVESVSPHRTLALDENDEFIEQATDSSDRYGNERDFTQLILENLKQAGVQQSQKQDRIEFTSLTPWPGDGLICAEGRFHNEEGEQRAAIFVGPEFGTVQRADLVQATREAADAGFSTLIACAFNFDAHSTDFKRLGRVPVLKARMNADLHMAEDLKSTGKGNLFVIFGEPDVEIYELESGELQLTVHGVDVFDPSSGEIRSDDTDGIACWFVDTDYNEESFFVRQAYFLGQNDPYKSLKTSLKAEIDKEAWASLHSNTSRPFRKPKSGRLAVKIINHLGDEVMKVFRVQTGGKDSP